MESCLSKWKKLAYLLISVCFFALSSTSSDAATTTYTLRINSAASVVHTSGGLSGQGMGDLSISGTFQAVVTDGVIQFHNINVTTNPSTYPDPGSTIVPSYLGTATQSGNGYIFSGSKAYDNSTGGGNFSGTISGTTFSMSGSFNAPCCDQYNYQFVLSGTVVTGVDTANNNFTMIDASGALVGGTNDVHFTWDGTKKTSVAASGQVSNASIFSTCPFFGTTWSAHDVAIYGPGTYSVYSDCPAGSPGCGTGTPITFTVGAGKIGGHILFDWNGTTNIDVVNVWAPEEEFVPSPMWTGVCGSNSAYKQWDWMSYDFNGDGVNGYPMVDGPFQGMNANFNLMEFVCATDAQCNDNNVCTKDACFLGSCVHTAVSCGPTGMYCDPATGNCVGCIGPCLPCTTDAQCGSSNACVTNACVAGLCQTTLIRCDDNNACTTDTCDPATGSCVFILRDCNDNNACTADTCDPATGCVHTPIVVCNDNNACTIDTCDPATGSCVFTLRDCNDNDPCTIDSCDVATGTCVHAIIINCNAGGTITTLAGNGTAGYSGDNGPATSASLYYPQGAAVDSAGNIYIADQTNSRIRKVDTSGTITTFAGNGTWGYSGDNGPAISARLSGPTAIAVDSSGNIYIADTNNYRIRKVDTGGIITTVAGNGTYGYSGDNGPATSASLSAPTGIAVDSSGNIYIADQVNNRIRKVDISGTIMTVAGNGTWGYSGDNGPATSASLYYALGVAVDASGNIYIADQYRIRKVDTGGIITTVAGNGTAGYSGDNGPATSARLNDPFGVAVDSSRNIYIADKNNNRIRKVDITGTITTVAGNGSAGFSGDNGPSIYAKLYNPIGVAVDSSGSIYIADQVNERIRKVTWSSFTCTGQPDGTPCEDGNLCTLNDTCQNGICTAGPVKFCTASDQCHAAGTCDPSTGVCSNPNRLNGTACNDDNVCTTGDSCQNGSCISGAALNCDDNNACTTDTCTPATGCVHSPIVCGPGTTCVGGACVIVDCIGNDPCTIVTKDPVTGNCVYTPINCDDGNSCTTDTCVAGVCTHTLIPDCGPSHDSNFTMLDPGSDLVGGTNDVVFAWDGTKRTSVAVSGQVSNALISSSCAFFGIPWSAHDLVIYGPGSYTIFSGCPAGSPGCGTGAPINFTVNAGEIGVHMLFDWNGNNDIDVVNVLKPNAVSSMMWTGGCGSNAACTVWAWESYDFDGDGVNGTPMVDGPFQGMNANFNLNKVSVDLCCDAAMRCNDNNACTVDTCNPATGNCVHTAIGTDDHNACTVDSCDPVTGVVHVPIVCNDNNACTTDTCDPATGCIHTPIQCPYVPCSNDSCNPITGCVYDPIDCSDGNACTSDWCDPVNGCQHVPISCDDNNICTADSCNPTTGCVHMPIVPALCNDNNACTIDGCTNNGCTHTAISADDNDICTIDSCNPATGVVHTPVIPASCNDNNACTIDGCTNNACTHTPISCNPIDACHTASCDAVKGCVQTVIGCDDSNVCTTDSCDPATGCVHTPISCDDGNICTTDSCNPASGCVHTPNTNCVVCAPGSPTTVTLVGGSGNPNSVDKEIQTAFTVVNHSGCILSWTKSTVTVSVGTTLQYNVTAGPGPQPSSCSFAGSSVPCGTNQITLTAAGTAGKLVLDNKANGGSDTDRITISAQ